MKQRISFVSAFSLCLLACGHHAPLPVIAAPVVTQRADALPALPLSTLVIPLAVPLSTIQDVVQERLVIPGAADWLQVTPDGESPEVAIRYQADAAAPQISTAGAVVRTLLPIRYHGSFRARVHTPFGWVWLTKETRWGTSDRRGLIEIAIASALSISPSWQLSSHSSLSGVRLTAPAVDKLCTGGVFKICVPAELAKDRVHRELDRQVRAKAQEGLAQVDAQAASRADLAGLAQRVWNRLQIAAPQPNGEELRLTPEGLALGYPSVRGDLILAELQVKARPTWSTEAGPAPTPLPAPSEARAASSEVHFDLPVSLSALSEGLSRGLASILGTGNGYRISRVEVLGSAAGPQRWLIAITLESEEKSSALAYGEASLLLEGPTVRLAEIQLSAASEGLVTLTGFSSRTLTETLSRTARHNLDGPLGARLSAIGDVLAQSVSPWPVSPLAGTGATLRAAFAAPGAVVFRAQAH